MSRTDELDNNSRCSDQTFQSESCFNGQSSTNSDANESRKRKRRRSKKSFSSNVPNYQHTYYMKEDSGSALYACAFNPYIRDNIFATAGGNRATIYRCSEDGRFKPLFSFMDSDEDNFYTCTWLYETEVSSHLLAVGGRRGVIHIIPFCGTGAVFFLGGHGQAINELATHPTNSCLLLSASKDNELRLWNVHSRVCVAIFGGTNGHKSEVLSCDFDILGERIVSGGMDHWIKVWSLLGNHRVDKAIQMSKTFIQDLNAECFPTVKVSFPDFSTRDVHKNYVDCVRWFGETLLSKSCENSIAHWKPGSQLHIEHSNDDSNVCLLSDCRLQNCSLWFIKFSIDQKFRLLATGNQVGRVYIWDLNALSAAPKVLYHNKCTATIRHVTINSNGDTLIAVCDDGTVWRWMQKKPSEKTQ